ncbi:MAG: ABC transporter permease [Bacillota bacterium]
MKKIKLEKIIKYILALCIVYFSFLPIISVLISGFNKYILSKNNIDVLIRPMMHLKNSLLISIIVTILATSIGFIISFTLNRLRFKFRKKLKKLAFLPLINPPFVGSIAFIMLFGKRGLISHQLLNLNISPFGPHGIIIIETISFSALAYIIMSSSIKNVDISLENAARSLGSSEIKIFKTITLPLMIPEISSAALLVFLASMADFTTPLIIGGSFQTLASDLYIQITGLYDLPSASLSGVVLLFPCIIVFLLQRYYLKPKSFFSDNIRSKDIEYKDMPKLLKNIFISITVLYLFFVSFKYIFIIIGAFTKQWGYNYTFTLMHVKKALGNRFFKPFINSIQLALIVAFISSIIGVILSYLLSKKQSKINTIIDFLGVIPAAVPGILFGIGYLITFKYPLFYFTSITLLGTNSIIYIISIFRYLNVGLRTGYSLIKHINPELENVAYNLGASKIKTFLTITVPLLKEAFYNAFYKNFSTTMTTLGAIIFLLLPSNKVAVQQIFQMITSSSIGVAATMSLILSLITLMFLLFFNFIFKIRKESLWK